MKLRPSKWLPILLLLAGSAIWALWLFSRSTQTLISHAGNGKLIRVHIKENGLVFAMIRGWPQQDGWSVRFGPIGASGFGIPMMFTGSASQHGNFLMLSRDWGPGFLQPPLGTAAVTGSDAVLTWPWLVLPATIFFLTGASSITHKRYRMQKRLAENRCVVCGYDLRATPDRCPECGTAANGVSVSDRAATHE